MRAIAVDPKEKFSDCKRRKDNTMILGVPFFLIALLYSLVGFGGGSSYIALLVIVDVPYELIPKIALLCNLIVVTGGSYHFIRRGHFYPEMFWPFVIASVPMAFIGGRIPISENTFLLLLGTALLLSGYRILVTNSPNNLKFRIDISLTHKAIVGALIGFFSGLVGIGGGIFLSPLLLSLNWGKPKTVAATSSAFIFVNSLAGLLGQLSKSPTLAAEQLPHYLPLFLAVFLGGQIGSRMGAGWLSPLFLRGATACLVIFVGCRLLLRSAGIF